MQTHRPQFSTFIVPEKKDESTDIRGTLNRYLYYWPLFIIGVMLALTLASIYIRMTNRPVYEIKATLLIKNVSDEKTRNDQRSALQEIDLSNSTKIIENEIEILKSKQLISKVVQDLKLEIGYQKKNGVSFQDLYKSSPVELTLSIPTGNYEKAVVNLIIKDNNSFFLIMPDGKLRDISYKSTFKDSFGTWTLKPTQKLAQYRGETIKIILLDPEQIALQYQNTINVSVSNKLATTIALSMKDQIPQRGKDILNDLIYNYNLAALTEKNRDTKSTLDFIDQRLQSLSGELAEVEKSIENFKSARGLTEISDDSKISLENMQANDAKLNDVNVQLSVIEGIERYINSASNGEKTPATLGIADPALSSFIEKLATLKLQRDRLLATTPETNPDFEPINRQIATTRAAIRDNVRSIKSSLLNTQQKLKSFNSHFESSIKNIPNQERQYISIKRQQAIKENLYTYLLQKREQVSVNYASTLANDRIVDQAYSGPSSGPQKALIYCFAIFLGVGLPMGIVYGRNRFSNKITTLQEIKEAVAIPIMTELSFESTQSPIVMTEGTTQSSAQFRSLRTKLYHMFGEREHGRVTLLTSSISGEGKSFVSSNLSLALAYSGKKTIILELDLRKPQLTDIFNLSKNHLGITDFILGDANLSDIVQVSSIDPNLFLISSGTTVNNPSELLERKALKELFQSLRNIYDDIIIDSPPLHLVPDAMIISHLTDVTLYIIRQGYTEKSELDFIKELQGQKRFSNMNLIFNGIKRMKYGYGYKYSSKYYEQNRKSIFSRSIFSSILRKI